MLRYILIGLTGILIIPTSYDFVEILRLIVSYLRTFGWSFNNLIQITRDLVWILAIKTVALGFLFYVFVEQVGRQPINSDK